MISEKEQKILFIKKLAKFLADKPAKKSIDLEMENPYALAWAEIRNSTPLFGYPSIEEAEKILSDWLL